MEMVERVARALLSADLRWKWESYDSETHDKYFAKARAAIAAMREPTAAMLEASPIHWDAAPVCDMWRAMIDAASEGK